MPATDLDAELTTERDHLDASRAALRRMRERAEALYATGDQVAGDAYGAESLGRALSKRIAELADDPETPIFFGRLRFTDGPPAARTAAGSPPPDGSPPTAGTTAGSPPAARTAAGGPLPGGSPPPAPAPGPPVDGSDYHIGR